MAKAQAKTGGETVHVYSTLANDQLITIYADNAERMNDLPPVVEKVLIKGGAGIASKNLITPMGIHTQLSIDEYNAIKDHWHFQEMVERGHLKVESRKVDIEAAIGDMNANDPSSPLTPADYEASAKDGTEAVPSDVLKAQ